MLIKRTSYVGTVADDNWNSTTNLFFNDDLVPEIPKPFVGVEGPLNVRIQLLAATSNIRQNVKLQFQKVSSYRPDDDSSLLAHNENRPRGHGAGDYFYRHWYMAKGNVARGLPGNKTDTYTDHAYPGSLYNAYASGGTAYQTASRWDDDDSGTAHPAWDPMNEVFEEDERNKYHRWIIGDDFEWGAANTDHWGAFCYLQFLKPQVEDQGLYAALASCNFGTVGDPDIRFSPPYTFMVGEGNPEL